MALEIDQQAEDASRKNEFITIEIYNIELNDGRVLYLASDNKNVTWGNNTYIGFTINRAKTSQEGGQTVGDNTITLGDKENSLTKEVLNNLSVIKNAFVTIFQQRESINGEILLGFRQVFRGRIRAMNGSIGIINFTVVAPFSDPQKPVNDKKFGEFEGMINVYKRIA